MSPSKAMRRKAMIRFLIALIIVLSPAAIAKDVTALFHPYDDNLDHITSYFDRAQSTIDMALYNIDSSERNPVVAWILQDHVQDRLKSGDLEIRLIFEGYESPEKVAEKMNWFESIGVDVKTLGRSQKMHHKYAVIDGYSMNPLLITGSANWSMMSQRHYNENTLFFDRHQALSQDFQIQFEDLWQYSDEVGSSKVYDRGAMVQVHNPRQGVEVFFNTDNFNVTNRGFRKKPVDEGFVLTRQLVKAIDQAETKIDIATTRIKLRPVYNAILRAANRGVKVNIIVTMQSYQYAYKRKKALMRDCTDEYQRKCSTSQDFALLLHRNDYPGKDNVEVRIKYFHVKKDAYLTKQMHSKYMIVDGNTLLTGSFNWSYSAEYNHLENLLIIQDFAYPEAMDEFQGDFGYLWNLGRDNYDATVKRFETAVSNKQKTACGFAPMTLTYLEIDYLLNSGKRSGGSLTKACK